MARKCPDCRTNLKQHAGIEYKCPGCNASWRKYQYHDYEKIKSLEVLDPIISNKPIKKDLTLQLDKLVDWWVKYFNKEIPFKVAWNWLSERSTQTQGLCYPKQREVRFSRAYCEYWFNRGDQKGIRSLVAHEMAHFLHKDSGHKSVKFLGYKKRWGFE